MYNFRTIDLCFFTFRAKKLICLIAFINAGINWCSHGLLSWVIRCIDGTEIHSKVVLCHGFELPTSLFIDSSACLQVDCTPLLIIVLFITLSGHSAVLTLKEAPRRLGKVGGETTMFTGRYWSWPTLWETSRMNGRYRNCWARVKLCFYFIFWINYWKYAIVFWSYNTRNILFRKTYLLKIMLNY